MTNDPSIDVVLTGTGLAKNFHLRPVFSDIAFQVRHGETLLISGRNGSGKSTLAKILARLLTPSSGTVGLTGDGRDVVAAQWQEWTGFVAPYVQLYEEFSASENLDLALTLRGRRKDGDRARQLLARIGLEHRASDPVRSFSSGMKQRVKFAFALMHHPRLLILDEPMTNLDSEGIAMVRGIMDEQRTRGILVVATNDRSDVQTADQQVDLHAR